MWADNSKVNLKENECENWIQLSQDRVQWKVLTKTVMKLRVQYKAEDCLTSLVTVSNSWTCEQA
jgi:hypothetical protein